MRPLDVQNLSRMRKERHLRSLSEDDFRDVVLRPLLLRIGFKDGRELCGPQEYGRDCLFTVQDPLGRRRIYVLQTKKGNVNMSSTATQNVTTAVTQLRTALDTPVPLLDTRSEGRPNFALLCASGKINDPARRFIVNEVRDSRVEFMDCDEIIDKLDECYPEFWRGVDADLVPYLRAVKHRMLNDSATLALRDALPRLKSLSAVSDEMYLPLFLGRSRLVHKRFKGRVEQVPTFEQFPVTSLIAKPYKRVLIMGDAGSGKTTALERLAYTMADRALADAKSSRVPVYLKCVDVSRSGASIYELCLEATCTADGTNTCLTESHFTSGAVWLLLDAVDEVGSDAERAELQARIVAFVEEYPKAVCVVTSRYNAGIHQWAIRTAFDVFDVSPIDVRQARELVTKLQAGEALGKERTQEIVRRLQSVHGMDMNPLLVTVFVATHDHARKDFPANATELFKKFSELMLGRWDASKGVSVQFQARMKELLLSAVAFNLHETRRRQCSLSEFERIVQRELADKGRTDNAAAIVDELCTRSGLLKINGDEVSFTHLLLQEFFAGRGIASGEYLARILDDPWWQRAIVFYCGDRPDDAERIGALVQAGMSRELHGEPGFTAAITIGLALQACYWIPVEQKRVALQAVVERLSSCMSELEAVQIDENPRAPLHSFLEIYLRGRDAVANDSIVALDGPSVAPEQMSRDDHVREFWRIVGMLESGHLDAAYEAVRRFKPPDNRLLLGPHLGAFLIQHLRVSSKEDKKVAEKICQRLEASVAPLRRQMLDELKSELLELRKDRLVALEGDTE